MKNQCITACLFGALFTLFSCGGKPQTNQSAQSSYPIASLSANRDTISLATFYAWTSAWNLKGKSFTDTSLTKYFTMPINNLSDILAEHPAAARFYIGLDISSLPYIPHLLLVGVDSSGHDMLNYANGQYVYNVTTPCPPGCIN